jgi:hypothetical protein
MGDACLQIESYWAQLKRSGAAQIAALWVGLRSGLVQPRPTLNVGKISLRSAQRDRGVTQRAASVSSGSRRALYSRSGAALPDPKSTTSMRRDSCGCTRAVEHVALVQSRARFRHAGLCRGGRLELIRTAASRPGHP